eukprot:TRINITY_DN390_c0_g1_i1.p1 TRINITY_DN390_c0_g1~~TRINITY_DN390_c0_g1_i1.p1  ORF type:complete len:234 (+),score=23.56 TRINITY_DN390_c0_g1_i1:75-776(+)
MKKLAVAKKKMVEKTGRLLSPRSPRSRSPRSPRSLDPSNTNSESISYETEDTFTSEEHSLASSSGEETRSEFILSFDDLNPTTTETRPGKRGDIVIFKFGESSENTRKIKQVTNKEEKFVHLAVSHVFFYEDESREFIYLVSENVVRDHYDTSWNKSKRNFQVHKTDFISSNISVLMMYLTEFPSKFRRKMKVYVTYELKFSDGSQTWKRIVSKIHSNALKAYARKYGYTYVN